MDTSQEKLLRKRDERDRLIALDRGELLQELVEGLTRRKVVEEILHGDAGPSEHRSAAHDV